MIAPDRAQAGSSSGEPASSHRAAEAATKPTVPPTQASGEADRGRNAEKPSDVPAPGWLDILSRTKQQVAEDNLSIVAAGIAFYGFVAVVPSLAAVISIYALLADPAQIREHITALTEIVPREVMPLLEEQMARITSDQQAAGVGLAVSLLIAIYSSSRATMALIMGLNIAYDEEEKRRFIKLNLVGFALTLFVLVGAVLAVALVALLPTILAQLPVSGGAETLLSWLRWPVLVGGFLIALTVLYRFAPSRDEPQWRWVSWGAILATSLWVIASAAFSLYVSRFGSYDKTYGSLGAVVVFLMWLFISAFVVLIGAELNAEMERQTTKDTTKGPPEPLGERGALAADTVGPSREQADKSASPKPQKLKRA